MFIFQFGYNLYTISLALGQHYLKDRNIDTFHVTTTPVLRVHTTYAIENQIFVWYETVRKNQFPENSFNNEIYSEVRSFLSNFIIHHSAQV